MQYCKQENFLIKIKDVLSEAFNISDFTEIADAYQTFTKGFDENIPSKKQCKKTIKKRFCIPITKDVDFIKKFLSEDYKVGVDLPVFISQSSSPKKTIMILGEDPLRELPPDEIILSTPFGTHLKKSNQKIYWDISTVLLNMGFGLYYTDINKIWMKHIGIKKNLKESIPNDLSLKFSLTLDKEIQIFQPQLIITFGKPAEDAAKIALEKLNKDIPSLHFIHPTFAARPNWKKNFGISKNSEVVNYIIQETERITRKTTNPLVLVCNEDSTAVRL